MQRSYFFEVPTYEGSKTASWPPKMSPFLNAGSDEWSCPPLPLELLRGGKKKMSAFPRRPVKWRHCQPTLSVCAYARVAACPRRRCAKRRGLRFGPMKRRRPLQVPPPSASSPSPCRHPGTRTLTVIGDCVLLFLPALSPSLLAPPTAPVLHFYLASTRHSWLLMQSRAHH